MRLKTEPPQNIMYQQCHVGGTKLSTALRSCFTFIM